MYYGDEQSQLTMNRAAYGDVAAQMMMGGNAIYGGAYQGVNNMLSDIGRSVMPVGYVPSARASVGFYGQYQQKTGFASSAAGAMGLGGPSRSQMAADYSYNVGADLGERVGGGTIGLATSVMATGVGAGLGKMFGGGILGSLAGSALGYAAVSPIMDAVGQRREINSYLESSSYRYVGAGSQMSDGVRGGMGASARRETTEFMTKLDTKDPFLNLDDMSQILQQGSQKGMFSGTQNMDDFKKKFKDLSETVKVVTRTLNQTLEEAMSTIKELKSIGIDPNQARQVVSQADTLGKIAGRTGAEMLNIGMQGAELFRGTGVNMGIGAQATMMNMASVRASRDAGLLSSEAVAQAGGEEALALRMNASGLGFAQSSMGRGMGAAFFNPAMGGAGFNQNAFMSQMMGGGMSMVGMAGAAANNLSSPAALIKYQANQEKFMSEAGKTFGGEGLQMMQLATGAAQAGFLSNATGASMEDSFRLSMKQQGMSQSEIEANLARMKNAKGEFASGNAAAEQTYNRAVHEGAYRNSTFVQVGSQIRDKFNEVVMNPLANTLSGVIDDVRAGVSGFVDSQVFGVQSGGRAALSGLKGTARKGTVNLDKGGAMATTAGEGLVDAAEQFGSKLVRNVVYGDKINDGESIVEEGLIGHRVVDVEKLQAESKNYNMSKAEITSITKDMKIDKNGLMLKAFDAKAGNAEEVFQALYQTKNPTKEQIAQASVSLEGTRWGSMVEQKIEAARKIGQAGDYVDTARVIEASGEIDSTFGTMKRKLAASNMKAGGLVNTSKISEGSLTLLAQAAQAKTPEERKEKEDAARGALLRDFGGNISEKGMQLIMGEDLLKEANKLGDANATLIAADTALGQSKISGALRETAAGVTDKKKYDNIVQASRELGGAKSVSALVEGVKKFKGDLKDTGTGSMIIAAADVLDDMSSGKATVEQVRSTLGEKFVSKYAEAARTDGAGRADALKSAANEALTQFQGDFSADKKVLGNVGAGDGGTTPGQTMAQQVNINASILQAMQGLANRLKL